MYSEILNRAWQLIISHVYTAFSYPLRDSQNIVLKFGTPNAGHPDHL